jgi:hypothetical protein
MAAKEVMHMSTSTPPEPGSINLSAWVCAFLAMTLMAALLQAIMLLAQAQVLNAHSRDTSQLVLEARLRTCMAETRWEDRARCETPDVPIQTTNVWPPRQVDSESAHPPRRPAQTALASAR